MTAPSWMTAEQAEAYARGTTAADRASAGVVHHEPTQAGHPYVAKPKSPKKTNATSTMDDAA